MIVEQQICQIGLGVAERGLSFKWDGEDLQSDPDNLLSGRGLSVDTSTLKHCAFLIEAYMGGF